MRSRKFLFQKAVVAIAVSICFGMTANALSMSSYTDGIHQAAASSTQAVTPTMDSNNNNNIQHNPFLQQEGLPKFSKIKPHHLTPAIDFTVAQSQIDFQQLENALSPSSINNGETTAIEYDQVLPQLERIKFPLEYTWSVASHLTAVKNSNELRKEYESNQGKVIQAMAQFAQSKSLYNALLEVQKNLLDQESSATASFLMKQKRRAVELTLRSMKHGGVGLEGSKKERLNEIKLRLATLSTSFSNNILDETQAFSLTINDSKSLRGVPESAKRLWHNAHRQFVTRSSGRDSNSSNGALGYVSWGGNGPMTYEEELYEEEYGSFGWTIGPWRITLDQPSYLAAMMHIPDRNLRQQIYMAHAQRASEASPSKNNIPVINEMLQLKNEMANILGYDNYVELSLSSKMASSKEAITELTDLVAEKAVPAAKRELEEIATFAIGYGGVEYHAKPLEPWDIPYWTERLKESKFDLTEEEIRPYFALPNVLDGLFQLVDRLFDVSIQEQRYAGETWHLDVSFYNMIDNISGQHIASFYLDPYSRPANKRGGAWMSSCIGKSSAVNRELPVAYVTCNINPPNKGKPSLLTFREVQSLFHEFGHALQHLLTKATVGAVSGINGIEVRYFDRPRASGLLLVALSYIFPLFHCTSGMLLKYHHNLWNVGVAMIVIPFIPLPNIGEQTFRYQRKSMKN